ncbi:MAG: cytidylate kinase-like family protein [Clostridia bacterium]|nr:cytidylate kinase-like family protein [Clostridia bacterium]
MKNGQKKQKIIVISRECGSGGSHIARMLAQRLGVPFYDKDFVDKAVEENGLSTAFMEEEEQKFISSLLFSLATGGYRHSDNKAMADQVFIAETNALKEVAQQGSCVIVGRCADYVLQDEFDVFSVFIHADLSWRAQRGIREYGLEPRRAEQAIRDKDRRRARHYEYYTDRTWGDRNNYHLSVNAARFTQEQAVELILQALQAVE